MNRQFTREELNTEIDILWRDLDQMLAQCERIDGTLYAPLGPGTAAHKVLLALEAGEKSWAELRKITGQSMTSTNRVLNTLIAIQQIVRVRYGLYRLSAQK